MISKLIRYVGGGFITLCVGFVAYDSLFVQADQASYPIDYHHASEVTERQHQIAEAALHRFLESCPQIEGQHVSEPKVELIPAMPYREDTYGWPWEVHVRIDIDEASNVAAGHTLDYYIWGDGWVTQKGVAAEFCGEDGNAGADTYVPFGEH